MSKNYRPKNDKNIKHKNVLESLKDVGDSTFDSIKKDVIDPRTIMDQLFGPAAQKNFSGEIGAGESVEIDEVFTGEHEEKRKLKNQLAFERNLRQEEQLRNKEKSNELRVQLQAIMQEVAAISKNTQELSQEIQIAAIQAPVEPGVYHIVFFEKLLEFLKSFRKKIEEASVWLHATNKRAQKKNYWGKYKQHGSKFLLSSEHYLQRSAG